MIHTPGNKSNTKLSELGEVKLLRDVIFPIVKKPNFLPNALGDDCVDFTKNVLKNRIVWTMDPTPTPVSWLIDKPDYFTYGWYSVLINLSDIASMGADPFGILLSVIAPEDMEVSTFKQFFRGVEDCCRKHKTYLLGGNLKDGKEFSCVGTALGSVNNQNILRRKGTNEGDYIVIIGEMGIFWASVFSKLLKISIPEKHQKKILNALYKPIAKLKEGQIISKERLATACMDNSDSIVSCCYELAYQNNLDFIITIDEDDLDSQYKDIFKKSGINALTAAFSWGDWNLVCTVPPNKFPKLQQKLNSISSVHKIGIVKNKDYKSRDAGAYYLMNGNYRALNKEICSERFQKQSYFTYGIENYIKILKKKQLWI